MSKRAHSEAGVRARSASVDAPARPDRRATRAARRVQPTRKNGSRPAPRRERKILMMLRRVPLGAWICAAVATLNAVCWSLIMPPFQIPDEPDHFAYVQQLAENGTRPKHLPTTVYSFEQIFALQDLDYYAQRRFPQSHAIAARAQQQRLETDLSRPLPRSGNGNAGVATNQPPLYYALQTIPYELGAGGTILDRLQLMRLLSALMAGFTALFGFLFLREVLPGTRWSWTVGGLGIALAPLLGYMSSGVNPDAMLYSFSAALFFCVAAAFRRGLSPRLGAAVGIVIVLGLLTKLNFIGLVPGAILGIALLALREVRGARRERAADPEMAARTQRRALGSLALAVGIPGVPILLFLALSSVTSNYSFEFAAKSISTVIDTKAVFKQANFIWQLYLPHLPGTENLFIGLSTTRIIWFNGLVGLYGWADTIFPNWVYTVAIVPFVAIVGLCLRSLVLARVQLRARLVELVAYLTMVVGLLVAIGSTAYLSYVDYGYPASNAQPRYLMPLIVLWGTVLALAARGVGRRWATVAGALLVTLILAHSIFSQLLVISRYYG